jgi:hypothetical protein
MPSKYGRTGPSTRPLVYDTQLKVLITREQRAQLHAIAEQYDCPFSQFIRELIDEAIRLHQSATTERA